MIYLDNNATTAVDPAVLAAMLPYLQEQYGNPSSMHRFGQEARQAVEKARFELAGLIGCDAKEIIFTSGGTESNNAAIHGLLALRGAAGGGAGRKTIVTSSVEHSAVREPAQALAKAGYRLLEVGVDEKGTLDLGALEAALRDPDVALASIMWANNETGVVFDVAAVGALCRKAGVPLHVDAVQAAGKLPLRVRDLPLDLLSVSGHKFHGPKGIGALYVRRGARWVPWIRGGPQERDRRGGTENVAGIVGMGVAAELARQAVEERHEWPRVAALRDHLEREILTQIPDSYVNGDVPPPWRLANTTNIGFAGLEAEAILLLLSERSICASAGAACSSGSLEPSHVLRAMHLPERIAHGAVRFSLSRRTTEAEVEEALAELPGIIARLRATLPV